MENYTLQKRREIVRRYAQNVFSNGTQFDQLEFLSDYLEKRNKHWDFESLIEYIESKETKTDNLDAIDQSIKNIIELNKHIN